MTFEQLNLTSPLLNALKDRGFTTPTSIQEKAYSVVMSGKDVVGLAQTGTGKTLAYVLPLLRVLPFSNQKAPRILIVVPTRELVEQVVEEIKSLTTYISIRVDGVYGGVNINTQKVRVQEGLDIIVATPGRLVDLALCGALKLRTIQKLVIDEVDEMMSLGFLPQLNNIFDLLPEKRQNLMFSATMTKEVEKLTENFFNSPERIEAARHGTPLEKIDQQKYEAPNFNSKTNLLIHLLDSGVNMNKVLVFTGSKKMADLLSERLNEIYPEKIGVIHSNKSQNFRFNSLKSFQSGEHRILIATDLVARGLDISDVTHVINFDIPDDAPIYIHRIGRTGRADKEGVAIAFVSEKEKGYFLNIEKLMDKDISATEVPVEVEMVDELVEFEKPILHETNFLTRPPKASNEGAFHEKSEKNSKTNEGEKKYHRELKKKYKKPQRRRTTKKKK